VPTSSQSRQKYDLDVAAHHGGEVSSRAIRVFCHGLDEARLIFALGHRIARKLALHEKSLHLQGVRFAALIAASTSASMSIGVGVSLLGSKNTGSFGPGSRPNLAMSASGCFRSASLISGVIHTNGFGHSFPSCGVCSWAPRDLTGSLSLRRRAS